MIKRKNHIACLFLMLISCIEPFDFKSIRTESTIVIDGSFTNETRAHTVLISNSYAIDTLTSDPVEGATVWIEDEYNNIISMTETEPGSYQTDSTVNGVPGDSYRLHVDIDGRIYESDWETMTPQVPIDSIYGRYVRIPSSENETFKSGVQFFVDAHDPTGQSSRFRYEWEETYKIETPLPSWYEWNKEDSSVYPRRFAIDVCFGTNIAKSMVLTSTDGLSENKVSELPVRFVDEESIALRKKYSLLVRQYSLNTNAYGYYKRLKENNESAGTFFDKQKGAIIGNLHALDNPDEVILGYFEVAGVTTSRDFFMKDEFVDDGFKVGLYPGCKIEQDADTVHISEMPSYFTSEGVGNLIVYLLDPPGAGLWVVLPPQCVDCRFHGELDKPEWWED